MIDQKKNETLATFSSRVRDTFAVTNHELGPEGGRIPSFTERNMKFEQGPATTSSVSSPGMITGSTEAGCTYHTPLAQFPVCPCPDLEVKF